MKYSIEGFNQRAVLSFRKEVVEGNRKIVLKLDITDLVILRWFVDFFPKMKKYTEANVQYAWVHYDSVLEDIPLLQIGKIPLYRRLQKMVSLGILTHKHVKVNGSFSYYGFGENYIKLIDDKEFEEPSNNEVSNPYDSKVTPPMISKSYPYDFKIKPLELESKTKDPSTKDSSTNNLSKKESKDAGTPKKEVKKTFNEIIDSYTDNEELREELKEHLKTRKKKRASLTNRSIELSLRELDKLADTDEEKILIVQNSIMGGYPKFYEIKKYESPKKENKTSYSTEEYERMIMSRYIDNDNETPKTQKTKSNFNLDEFEKYLTDKYKK